MKTVFITGADGFNGRRLFALLKSRGHDVVGGVRNRARKLAFERQLGKALVCDVSDAISVARAIASVKPEIVVHLAGVSRPNDATHEPLSAYQSIVTGWANVLDGVRRSTPRAKVLLVSAADVYGTACAAGAPVAEDCLPQPVNTFGAFKLAAEAISKTFYQNYHLDITVARPFHGLGAGLSDQFFFASVASRLANWDAAIDGTKLALPDLDFRRDLLHVQDMAEAFEKLLTHGRPNETYNVCSGQSRSVREIVLLLASAAGQEITLTAVPADGAVSVAAMCGSCAKITEHTGWKPTRSLESAASELIDSFRKTAKPVSAGATRVAG